MFVMETITFNLRDLNRRIGEVLKTCDEHGSVEIEARDGRRYSLKSESAAKPPPKKWPDFAGEE